MIKSFAYVLQRNGKYFITLAPHLVRAKGWDKGKVLYNVLNDRGEFVLTDKKPE